MVKRVTRKTMMSRRSELWTRKCVQPKGLGRALTIWGPANPPTPPPSPPTPVPARPTAPRGRPNLASFLDLSSNFFFRGFFHARASKPTVAGGHAHMMSAP